MPGLNPLAGRGAGEWRVVSECGQWPVARSCEEVELPVMEKCQNKANLLAVSVVLIVGRS